MRPLNLGKIIKLNEDLSLKLCSKVVKIPSGGLYHVSLWIVREAVEVRDLLRLRQFNEGRVHIVGIFVSL